MAAYDRVWSVAVADGDSKFVFVGRESGVLEKRDAASLGSANPPALSLSGHTGAVTAVLAASADEVTTVSTDGTMRTWNTAAEVEGRREGKTLQLPAGARCALVAGEATYVGLSNGHIVKVEAGAIVSTIAAHRDAVVALAVSDVALFSASYDNSIRAFELASGAAWFHFSGHKNQVKGIVVNGSSLISCDRDNTCFVWNIPAEGPTAPAADADAAAAEPEEGADAAAKGDGEGAESAPAALEPIVVDPVGEIGLPATPHGLTTVGTQLVVAGADGSVRGLTTKALLKAVADYAAGIEQSCAAATRQITSNTAIKIKNAKRIAKRKTKQSKADIIAAEAAAKGEAPPEPKPAADDEEEPAEVEADADENAPALSEEAQAKVDEAAAAHAKEAEEAIAKADSEKAAQVEKLAPIRKQRFVQRTDQFATCAWAATFRLPASEPVLALAADGAAAAVAAAGAAVVAVPARVGVQSL